MNRLVRPLSHFVQRTPMAPQYIEGSELASLIRSSSGKSSEEKGKPEVLVVDVRDDDYTGGNIVGSVNHPSREFMTTVNDLVKTVKEKEVGKVVFHCSLSQVRGPKAARVFEEVYTAANPGSDSKPEVLILRDGFTQFQAKFKEDADLVEKWDKEVWNEEYS